MLVIRAVLFSVTVVFRMVGVIRISYDDERDGYHTPPAGYKAFTSVRPGKYGRRNIPASRHKQNLYTAYFSRHLTSIFFIHRQRIHTALLCSAPE